MKNRTVVALVAGAAVSGAVIAGTAVSAATPDVTYFACLKNGTLSNVGTAAPEGCTKGSTVIDWNSVGPQGPQGVEGPQGVAGPTGPAGGSGYFTFNSTHQILGNANGTVIDFRTNGCPGGRKPIGGGYKITEVVPDTIKVVGSHISTDPNIPGWTVEYEVKPEGANMGSTLTLESICAYL